MNRPARFLLPTLLTAAAIYAEDDAIQVLRQVIDSYKNLTTYRIEQTAESLLTSELHHSWQKQLTTIAVDKSNKMRFESRGDTSWYLVVSDGKTLWRATPYIREWSRIGLGGPLSEVKGGGAEA